MRRPGRYLERLARGAFVFCLCVSDTNKSDNMSAFDYDLSTDEFL